MEYTGVLKRVFPFMLTFAAGLVIASFFVSIAAPSFGWGKNRNVQRHREFKRMKMEIRDLKRENQRLRREVEVFKSTVDVSELDRLVPPPPPAPPSYRGEARVTPNSFKVVGSRDR
jgi:hypothetical protein